MRFSSLISIVIFVLSNAFTGAAQDVDRDGSFVAFEISNLGINLVDGTFRGFEGVVLFDATDLSNSSFEMCIDPATVNSGNSSRDKSLLEEDYFHVARYPSICFKSDTVVKTGDGFLTTGILTLKGTSSEVSIPFTAEGNRLKGTIEIDRTEYGVGPSGGFLVGRTATLTIVCALESDIQ
jgi:polyisoprenoid-binding protein YceI